MKTWSLSASPPFAFQPFLHDRVAVLIHVDDGDELFVAGGGEMGHAPRPPQPIWTKRILSPALAALRMLKGAADKHTGGERRLFHERTTRKIIFHKSSVVDVKCHTPRPTSLHQQKD